jgi:hypothetical protein
MISYCFLLCAKKKVSQLLPTFKNIALLLFSKKQKENNYTFPFLKFLMQISVKRKKMLNNQVSFTCLLLLVHISTGIYPYMAIFDTFMLILQKCDGHSRSRMVIAWYTIVLALTAHLDLSLGCKKRSNLRDTVNIKNTWESCEILVFTV